MQISPDLQAWLRNNPPLAREREQELLIAYKRGDRRAFDTLVASYLPLVLRIASQHTKNMRNAEQVWPDMVNAGITGLVEALNRYDCAKATSWSEAAKSLHNMAEGEKGAPVRLATYAMHYIRANVAETQTRDSTVVHCTKTAGIRRALTHLARARRALASNSQGGDLALDEAERIANYLKVSPAEVREAMRVQSGDVALDAPRAGEDSESVGSSIRDENAIGEDDILGSMDRRRWRLALMTAVAALTRRSRMVLVCRHYLDQPMTLENLARLMGVSRERVRQIEAAAVDEVKRGARRAIRFRLVNEEKAREASRVVAKDIAVAAKGGSGLTAALARDENDDGFEERFTRAATAAAEETVADEGAKQAAPAAEGRHATPAPMLPGRKAKQMALQLDA